MTICRIANYGTARLFRNPNRAMDCRTAGTELDDGLPSGQSRWVWKLDQGDGSSWPEPVGLEIQVGRQIAMVRVVDSKTRVGQWITMAGAVGSKIKVGRRITMARTVGSEIRVG